MGRPSGADVGRGWALPVPQRGQTRVPGTRRTAHSARRYSKAVSAEKKNFEAIVKAKSDQNRHCPFPPHAVRMNPFDIERMQWMEGDMIAGLALEAVLNLG